MKRGLESEHGTKDLHNPSREVVNSRMKPMQSPINPIWGESLGVTLIILEDPSSHQWSLS